jgi:hypothetical protein
MHGQKSLTQNARVKPCGERRMRVRMPRNRIDDTMAAGTGHMLVRRCR